MNKKSGFSLIELMTVIIIIGIMVGIAVPALTRNLPYRRLADGRSQVKSDLSLMRQKSLVESRSYGAVVLVANTNQYILFEDVDGDGTFNSASDRTVSVKNLPTRINFAVAANQTLTFLRTGILSGASATNILLQNDRNQQLSLTVMLSGVVID